MRAAILGVLFGWSILLLFVAQAHETEIKTLRLRIEALESVAPPPDITIDDVNELPPVIFEVTPEPLPEGVVEI